MKFPKFSLHSIQFTIRGINKKYLLVVVIFSVLLGATVIIIKKVQLARIKKIEQQKLTEEQKRQEEEALLKPSPRPLSPSEVIEREEKIAGGKLEIPVEKKSEGEKEAKKEEGITKQEIKIVDDEGLITILKELLINGNPSLTYLTLREMTKRGINPVPYLKKEIIDHPDDPGVRKNALIALFYIGDEGVVPIFKASAKVDPDEKVREVALFCLDFLTGKETMDFFKEVMEKDPSMEVRVKAREYWEIRKKCTEEKVVELKSKCPSSSGVDINE